MVGIVANVGLAAGGKIEAEFVTPYGKPVEGFTRADCLGISANGKDQEIKWRNGVDPASLGDAHLGGLCLKFYLKNAKIYSHSYLEPDPACEIASFWDSARYGNALGQAIRSQPPCRRKVVLKTQLPAAKQSQDAVLCI